MEKFAFLDRDGTIIWEPERPDGVDPRETFPLTSADQVSFLEGALENLKTLIDKEYKLVLVTNQTFLGTPKHPQETFDQVMKKMSDEFSKRGIHFEFVMVCPHGPDEGCGCRKPKIGGVQPLLEQYKGRIDFSQSFMFGDRDTDEEFAKNLGVRFVKIPTNGRFALPEDI